MFFIFIRYTYARTDNRTNTCTGHHQTAIQLCYFDIINGHKPCIVTRRTCQDFQEKQKRHCTKQDIKDSKAMNKLPKSMLLCDERQPFIHRKASFYITDYCLFRVDFNQFSVVFRINLMHKTGNSLVTSWHSYHYVCTRHSAFFTTK